MTKIHKIATYLLVGTLAFAGRESFVRATPDEDAGIGLQATEEPIAGIDLALDEVYQSSEDANKKITQYLTSEIKSEYDDMAFAQVTDYVNIRSDASESSEILGKLYNDSTATIISKTKGWYQIKSGSVTGYIKAEFLVTGDDAAKIAKSIGRRVAEVTTVTLKVREKPTTDSTVLTLVAQGDDFKVIKEMDGWVKVYLSENETGYVSTDFVKLQTVYEEAVSIQEEQDRLEEEAAANDQASDSSSNTNSNRQEVSYPTRPTSSSSDLGSNIAAYAQQFRGNPYVWGGTSLTNGADCSGFTQSVFAHFGISIPRTSRTQATGGSRVSLDNLHSGDLIFYTRNGTINHVALYIGNGKVISASSPSTGIRISNYNYRQPYKAVSYIN